MKVCPKCVEERPLSEFYNKHTYCKECDRLASRQYHYKKVAENPDHYRDGNLRKNYGLTAEEYAALLLEQEGVCAICRMPETKVRDGKVLQLCVDHDHETNEIRGLLCNTCNRAIGLLHDEIELLERAVDYLKKAVDY